MGQMASMTRAEMEDRVYELSADHTTREMAAELGISWDEARAIAKKVFEERSNPNLVAAREAIRRLGEIRFV
jgi:hypothetical protein